MAVRPGWAQSEQVMAMAFFTDGALEPAALHDRGAACARAACGWRRGGGGGVGARPLRVRLHAQLSVDFVPKTAAAVRALCAVTALGVIVLMADDDAAAPRAAHALRARSRARAHRALRRQGGGGGSDGAGASRRNRNMTIRRAGAPVAMADAPSVLAWRTGWAARSSRQRRWRTWRADSEVMNGVHGVSSHALRRMCRTGTVADRCVFD